MWLISAVLFGAASPLYKNSEQPSHLPPIPTVFISSPSHRILFYLLLSSGSCSAPVTKALLVSCSHMLGCPPKAAPAPWAAPPSPHCPWDNGSFLWDRLMPRAEISAPLHHFHKGATGPCANSHLMAKITFSLVTFQQSLPSYPWIPSACW